MTPTLADWGAVDEDELEDELEDDDVDVLEDEDEERDPCEDCRRCRPTVKFRGRYEMLLCGPCTAKREGLHDAFPGGSV
jgi:hypothetical protein